GLAPLPALLGVILRDGQPSHLLDELFEWIAHGLNSSRRRRARCMHAWTRHSWVVDARVALERSANDQINCGWVITVIPLYVRDQSPLRAGVAIDVALRRFDGAVPREQLHVAQAASRAMNVAGGDGDEATPAGMRRAALEAELLEPGHEPVDHTVRLQVRTPIRADDCPNRLRRDRQP